MYGCDFGGYYRPSTYVSKASVRIWDIIVGLDFLSQLVLRWPSMPYFIAKMYNYIFYCILEFFSFLHEIMTGFFWSYCEVILSQLW